MTSLATRRTSADLAAAQFRAIDAFSTRRAGLLAAVAAATVGTREMRMDAARRLDVIRRQQDALIARTHDQLLRSGAPLTFEPGPRAVLAHRSPWFVERVREALRAGSIDVVAISANGADAVGTAVAEQPDLILVEDCLEMLPGEDVVREVREFCPDAVIAAQVAYGDRVAALLEAGASTVFTRQVPPAEVAAELCELVGPR